VVSVAELGIAFTLFIIALMEEPQTSPISPLSHSYVETACSDESAVENAMAILGIHYDSPDVRNVMIERINCFVLLLRRMRQCPTESWHQFIVGFDRFVPVLHAIAWCPASAHQPFDEGMFRRIARSAPIEISELPMKTI
jgi:hypothetical protein